MELSPFIRVVHCPHVYILCILYLLSLLNSAYSLHSLRARGTQQAS